MPEYFGTDKELLGKNIKVGEGKDIGSGYTTYTFEILPKNKEEKEIPMNRWKIVVRRDTIYEVRADTFEEACEAARIEDWSQIETNDLDWETILKDQSFQIDEEGNYLEEEA